MKKVALYVRVSTEEQAVHGDSLEAQRAALTAYAEKHNYLVTDIYIDEGYSARKTYKKRHEFLRLLRDVECGKFELILFTKLDRWFRNVKDYYAIQTILETHNIAWKTTDEDYDTATANGRLHLNIKLSIAQDEADRTSERIKFVFANKAQRGEVISGSVPIGYKIENKRTVIDPEKAPIVLDVFEHFAQTQSKHATMLYVQQKYNAKIIYNTITRMLQNPLYKGMRYDNPDFCEPLVSCDLWEKVQNILSKNIKRPHTHRVYLFSGLMRCPLCGGKMCGTYCQSKYKDKVYNVQYYRCIKRAVSNTCSYGKRINENAVEEYLLNHIQIDIKSYLIDYKNKQSSKTPKINKAKIQRRMERLKELYLEDLIDKVTYKRDYAECQHQLHEAEMSEKNKPLPLEIFNEFLREDFRECYLSMKLEERQMLWRSIIKEIKITEDKKIQILL